MSLRVMLVDDESLARERLKALLADMAGELPTVVVAEAENGIAALAAYEKARPDIVLTDIRMPRMDGIELARHLCGLSQPPAVVFVTAFDQYAVQAFELNAIDYLLKPVRAARLATALRKAAPLAREQVVAAAAQAGDNGQPAARRHLTCSERGRLLVVPIDDVLYLKADLKYVTARTREREYLLDESLVQLEQELAQRFVRVHRNALVAPHALAGFQRVSEGDEGHWEAILHGIPERLPISRRQWPHVKELVKG